MGVLKIDKAKHAHFLEENRKDPVTGDCFAEGDEVVFCRKCQSAFLHSSWIYVGSEHCGQKQTLSHFPKPSKTLRIKHSKGKRILKVFYSSRINKWYLATALALFFSIISLYFMPFGERTYTFVPLCVMMVFAISAAWDLDFLEDFWNIHERGLSESSLKNRLLFWKNPKVFVPSKDIRELVIFIESGFREAGKLCKADIWFVSNDENIYFVGNFEINSQKMLTAVHQLGNAYPLCILSQKWLYGEILRRFLINHPPSNDFYVNVFDKIAELKNMGMPVELAVEKYEKIYYCDILPFVSMNNTIFARESLNGDAILVVKEGIWLRSYDRLFLPNKIMRLKFKASPFGFSLELTLTRDEYEQNPAYHFTANFTNDAFHYNRVMIYAISKFAFDSFTPLIVELDPQCKDLENYRYSNDF